MNIQKQYIHTVSVLLLLAAVLLGSGITQSRSALAAPASAPDATTDRTVGAATLPPATCTATGATTRTCDLWATTGTLALPGGATVPIWGYTDSATGTATLPGPALIVNEGETVTVNLTNNLLQTTSIAFHGQTMLPDLIGVASGGIKTYTFVASNPGTYLYEAGLLPNSQHQTAMGLFGALIVRSVTPNQAYHSADSTYEDEALVVLSEIDPNLNNSANPGNFDLRDFTPRYWLINGQAYPDTTALLTTAGNRVLLRYVNAGLQHHSMSLLGLRQTLLAADGELQPYPHTRVAESIAPGQTLDTITAIPASAAIGAQYALYDANLLLNNNGAAGFGGMLTFLSSPGSTPGGDIAGPTTGAIALTPNGGDVAIAAFVDDSTSGNSNIISAEYYIDDTNSTPTPMTAQDAAFDAPTETVVGTIPAATLSGLSSGTHTVYVRGQDAAGNWGAFAVTTLQTDNAGPATSALSLTPNPSAGSADVALSGTGNDTVSGNSNISAAEYFIDVAGADGTGIGMAVNQAASIASLDAIIAAATVQTLSEGSHLIYVHSQDAVGNWGDLAQIELLIDRTGPDTTITSVAPNPANGTQAVRIDVFVNDGPAVVAADMGSMGAPRVFVPLVMSSGNGATDQTVQAAAGPVVATVATAEGFLDTQGADGTGFPFTPIDGLFNSTVEAAYALIPQVSVNQLANGTHTLYVHGKDGAGNWGPIVSTSFVVERGVPTVSGAVVLPNPTNGATIVTLTANADDAESAIAFGEWYVGADPGQGNGNLMTATANGAVYDLSATIDVSSWSVGNYALVVRARDAAGNWSTTTSVALDVNIAQPSQLYFSTAGNGTVSGVPGPYDDADIYLWNETVFSRIADGNPGLGLPGNADIDGLTVVSANQFYVSFDRNAGTNVPGVGAVQDEDIVYYNNGVWSLYFDGSTIGLGGSNAFDIDAFDIDLADGTIYFSTAGAAAIPGVAGPYDDADIYKWDGANFERIFDASAEGLPNNANVDALVTVTPDHYYFSLSAANTNVPGLGTVQDEDVVEFDGGTWTLYFDGTTQGLNGGAQNLDAIDIQ